MKLKIEVDNKKVQLTLKKIYDDVLDTSVVSKAIARWFEAYVAESFDSQGMGQLHVKYGTAKKWDPLKPGTVELRSRGGNVPLQDTGEYRKSYVANTDGTTFVEIGTAMVPLAYWHEYGTGIHGRGRGWYLIQVKNKKVLAARLRGGGFKIFGKYAKHEGVPERPVLPTVNAAEMGINDLLNEMGKKALADAGH